MKAKEAEMKRLEMEKQAALKKALEEEAARLEAERLARIRKRGGGMALKRSTTRIAPT